MAYLDLTWKTARPAEGFYTSEVEVDQPQPIRTFLPLGYEPRYAYPLLVFFHGQGGSEEQILRLAPRMSRRNFIAIGLRGPVCVGARTNGQIGYSWGNGAHQTLLEDYLIRAVRQTRLHYHVHSERIYLAGFAEGATQAYRLALAMPDKLGGVISLNGIMPRYHRPLFRVNEMRDLQVFMAHGIANSVSPLSLAREDYQLLYSAGVKVDMKTYPTTQRLHPDMLRDVNRWIVDRCNEDL